MNYESWDAGDLRELQRDLQRAVDRIHSAEGFLEDYDFTGKASILDSLCDAVNDLEDELAEIDMAVCEANKRELKEELDDYFEAIGF